MDAKGVAFRGRKQIDHQQMHAGANELQAFVEELLERPLGILVAWRNDLDDRDGAAQPMFHHDAVGKVGVKFLRRLANDSRRRRRHGQQATAVIPACAVPQSIHGQHVRFLRPCLLLDESCYALRQHARIQSVLDADRPRLMKVVEKAGVNTGPIMNRHRIPSQEIVLDAGHEVIASNRHVMAVLNRITSLIAHRGRSTDLGYRSLAGRANRMLGGCKAASLVHPGRIDCPPGG